MLEENLFLIIILILALYYVNKVVIENSNKSIINIIIDSESIPPRSEEKREGMSGGTLQQIFAQDNQNIALNGYGNSHVRSGDFSLRFNQPSKMVGGTQRGAPSKKYDDLEVIDDAYTGDYAKLPLFDIAKPIIYDE